MAAGGWKGLVREGASRALRWSGARRLVHLARPRPSATILFYHDPAPAVLDRHLAYLGRRFAFSTLDAVVDALRSGDWSPVPANAVVLTLDDGHRGNHALLPVFRKHGVRPTIYLCSSIVGTQRRYWFFEASQEVQRLKTLSSADRLEALRRNTGFECEREYPAAERQALSAEEIDEMAPWVDFGAHTRFHPVLTQCTDEEAWHEIEASKRELEERLGRTVRHFSYPNGDYTGRECEYARKAGFDSARTVDLGWVHRASDPYRLRVFGVTDDASVDLLAAQLSGAACWLRRALDGRVDGSWKPNLPSETGSSVRGLRDSQ